MPFAMCCNSWAERYFLRCLWFAMAVLKDAGFRCFFVAELNDVSFDVFTMAVLKDAGFSLLSSMAGLKDARC
jgi:hypothetical protein